jgi:phosphoribosyl-ATP pyrophosphohydrolase/phosphoribosyl-AMP cyclohydrolase
MGENLVEKINWQKCNGLIPAIIQDYKTCDVLMLGFMNVEALELTIATKKVHFFSRTKNRIWMKGETSGDILNLTEIKLDCDFDSLLVLVNPLGDTCHLQRKSCFDKRVNFLLQLEDLINERFKSDDEESYIVKMRKKGINKIAQKVGEEAVEAVIAALNESDERFLNESADLIFHLMLLLRQKGLLLEDVIEVLRKRMNFR